MTLNLTDVIIKITLVRFETGKVFIKMGRVVVVTFEENIDTSAGASVD